MSFISNLRNSRKIKSYTKKNQSVFDSYFKTELSEEQLNGVIDLMDHPEIRTPLIDRVSDLLNQPNFNDEMKSKFVDKLSTFRETESIKTAKTLMTASNQSLFDDLSVHAMDAKISIKDRVVNKIKQTYDNIFQKFHYNKNRVVDSFNKTKDDVSNSISNVSDNVVSTVKPALDMTIDGVKRKYSLFKEEYRTRKLSIQNDLNLSKALDNNMTAEQVAEGFDLFEFPEIRYGMINQVDKILNLTDMTPDMVDTYYKAAAPYVEAMPKNELRERFETAFMKYHDGKSQISNDIPDVVINKGEPDAKTYKMESENVWTAPTDNDIKKLTPDELYDTMIDQYGMSIADEVIPVNLPSIDEGFESLEASLVDERDSYEYTPVMSEEDMAAAFSDGLISLPDNYELESPRF